MPFSLRHEARHSQPLFIAACSLAALLLLVAAFSYPGPAADDAEPPRSHTPHGASGGPAGGSCPPPPTRTCPSDHHTFLPPLPFPQPSLGPPFSAPIPGHSAAALHPASEPLPWHLAQTCTMDSCFDWTRCLRRPRRVFVYNATPPEAQHWMAREVVAWMRRQPWATDDPEEACLFFPDLPLQCLGNACHAGAAPGNGDALLRTLPHWNGGRNHLLWTENDFHHLEWSRLVGLDTTDRAIVLATNARAGGWRHGFDVALPLESRAAAGWDWAAYVPRSARERRWLLSFKGTRYGGCGEPLRSALRWLDDGKDVVVRMECNKGERIDHLCPLDAVQSAAGPGYDELLAGARFGLVPRGCGVHSYRLSDLLRAGTVPVILADGFVPPLLEASGTLWNRCALHLPESSLPWLVSYLRNFTAEEVQARMDACGELYSVWSGGKGRRAELRVERFGVAVGVVLARLGAGLGV
ncbi:exostosin family-domain-containing protein [Hyaloraphidium curvatum]|nr:exostosin family-domain-containing protein [Hyaloraphidium curvatum]